MDLTKVPVIFYRVLHAQYTVVHKKATVNLLQQLVQTLTHFDNFCTTLTRNEFYTSHYHSVPLTMQTQKTLFHVSDRIFFIKA